jgi:hypothetical protein
MQRLRGGCTRPLNRNVPYTNSAKPTTWSPLNVSHPRLKETIQINSVRHVSIVDLDVALIDLVTERPKKLKPLETVSSRT